MSFIITIISERIIGIDLVLGSRWVVLGWSEYRVKVIELSTFYFVLASNWVGKGRGSCLYLWHY